MNELGIVGFLVGIASIFFWGKMHEKKKNIQNAAIQKSKDAEKEREIKNEVHNSSLSDLVDKNNSRYGGTKRQDS